MKRAQTIRWMPAALAALAVGCGISTQDAPTIVTGDTAPDPAPVKAPPKPADAGTAIETDAPTELPTTPPFVSKPTLANAGAATCAVGEAILMGEGGKRLQSLEVGFGPQGGLVAWPVGKHDVAVVAIDPAGAIAGRVATVEIPGARNVFGIEALADRFALLTHDLCPNKKYLFKCLYARLLDPGGNPLGEPTTEITREWVREEFHERIGPDGIWVLRSHMYVPPVINSLGVAGSEVAIDVVGTLDGGGDLSWARGFAVHERRWYALVESEEGRLALVSNGSFSRPLHWLSVDSKVLGFTWHNQELVLLFAPLLGSGKAGRPRVARLNEAGEIHGKPRTVTRGEPLPSPFADQVQAVLSKQGKRLVFQRQDPSGGAIGESTAVAPFPGGGRDNPRLAVTWTGDRFLAVWSSFEDKAWKIYAAPIECRPGAREY